MRLGLAAAALALAACSGDGTSTREAYVAKSCGAPAVSATYDACARRAKEAFLGPPAGVIFSGESGPPTADAVRTAR